MTRILAVLILLCALGTTVTALRNSPRYDERSRDDASNASTRPTASAPEELSSTPLVDYTTHPIVDPADRDAPRKRIVSLSPGVTEMCAALGLADQIVGRTRYCLHPPSVSSAEPLGALLDLNAELLLLLKPDLVLLKDQSTALAERLASLGIQFESIPDTRLADVFDGIRKIGRLTGRVRSAELLCRALSVDLDRAAAGFNDRPAGHRPRVLLLTGIMSDPPSPPYIAGPGSYFDDLLQLAGGENIARGAPYGPLSLEIILREDPDVIIELDDRAHATERSDVHARAIWRRVGPLQAVSNGRIRVIVGSQHFLAGPRMAFTLREIRRAVRTP